MGHPTRSRTTSSSRTRKSPPRASRPARKHKAVQVAPAAPGKLITNNILDAFTMALR